MTNKEWKIKNLRQSWGDLLLKKMTLLKDIFTIEYKLNQIKEELLRYGVLIRGVLVSVREGYRDWETDRKSVV